MDFGMHPTMICESPILDVDARKMQATLKEVLERSNRKLNLKTYGELYVGFYQQTSCAEISESRSKCNYSLVAQQHRSASCSSCTVLMFTANSGGSEGRCLGRAIRRRTVCCPSMTFMPTGTTSLVVHFECVFDTHAQLGFGFKRNRNG